MAVRALAAPTRSVGVAVTAFAFSGVVPFATEVVPFATDEEELPEPLIVVAFAGSVVTAWIGAFAGRAFTFSVGATGFTRSCAFAPTLMMLNTRSV